MLFERKLIKEVNNKYDMDLAFIEYKASVYDEIASYLSENNCSEGMRLVNKAKEEIDNFIITLKNDLVEIENICSEITKLIKDLYTKKHDIPQTMIINNKNIFISREGEIYAFVYLIGFDEYKKQYRYGIIKANINKGKLYNEDKKIGFSNDSNLERYTDFKSYFKSILNDFDNCESIEALDFLKKSVHSELARLFYTDDLRTYLVENNETIYKLTGIKGVEILRELYKIYDINKVKIKLTSNGYSIEDDRLIELVRSRQSCIKLLAEIQKLDDGEEKKIKDILIKSVKEKSQDVELLMKELNISSVELEIAVDKVNSTI